MKIFAAVVFLVLVFSPAVFAQSYFNTVKSDTGVCFLNGADKDTVVVVLLSVPDAKVAFDTSKANRTLFKPPRRVFAAGGFTLWLERTNVTGTATNFKVYWKPVNPRTGRLSFTDSTFVVGSSGAFANITNNSNFTVAPNETKAIAFITQCSDVGTVTKLILSVDYSQ